MFWFDVAGINDLGNFLHATGTYGVTGQYMTGFFPVMMLGLPGAALAMYVTAKSARRKVAAGVLFSSAIASFFVGVTEPLEFSFMFLAPGLYVVHALFTGISMGISALLPVRMGFGFSGGFIDLVLGWVNPMAQNPWAIPLMGIFWFVVYFVVFRAIILKFDLNTPGRDEDDQLTDDGVTLSGENKHLATATAFLTALGGKENIIDLENCATRLRMEVADTTVIDEAALKRAGAAGTMKPGGQSVQVIYGTSVQFVKDAMESIITGRSEPVAEAAEVAAAEAAATGASGTAGPAADGAAGTAVRTTHLRASASAPRGQCRPAVRGPRSDVRAGGHGPGRRDRSAPMVRSSPRPPGPSATSSPQGHAVALVLDDGTELLIHVGLDSVQMKGEGFTTLVEPGQRVSAGTPLLRADLSAIRVAGITPRSPRSS